MFDIGGWEFLVIMVIAILVIGPRDLPATIRTVTGWIRRARALAHEFQSGLDDLAREAELDSVRNDLQSGVGLDEVADAGRSIRREIEQSIDPGGEVAGALGDGNAAAGDAKERSPPDDAAAPADEESPAAARKA